MDDKKNLNIENASTDDFDGLNNAFSLTDIHYVDLSFQEHLIEVLARWPLLDELSKQQLSKQ